jgi:DMSO/TMAO reductase YedYZ molybdopterin-dependent catalytic subunit
MKQILRQLLRVATGKTAVTSLLAGIAAVAGSFAAAGFTAEFAFTPVSEVVVHYTPGVIINTTLDVFGDLGQYINMAFTLSVTIILFTALIAVAMEIGRRTIGRGVITLGLVWLAAVGLTAAPLLSLGAAIPATGAVVMTYRPWGDREPDDRTSRWPDEDRREVLGTSLGVVGFAGASYLAGSYRTPDLEVSALVDEEAQSEADQLVAEAEQKDLDLPGSPGLLSDVDNFYNVDIATVAPQIDAESWELTVDGEVDQELSIAYEELQQMESETQFSTLRCVGEDLNGAKMDNAVWTGVPARGIIDQAGADTEWVRMHADDGFHNTIPMEAFEQSLLVYGMNGFALPRDHGHPVRVIVPGHWGEVNVKWLTRIEFTDEDVEGYWEERGWEGTGEVSAVAKLWTTEQTEDGLLLGGQAYDGHDGVSAVEVSLDGGETWEDARLSERLSRGDGWRQWRYEADPDPGEYEVVVRAVDDDGEVQEREPSDSFPDGATGWVSDTATVE